MEIDQRQMEFFPSIFFSFHKKMNIKTIELFEIFWTGDDSTEYFSSNEVQICLFVLYHFELEYYQWHIFFPQHLYDLASFFFN